MRERIELPQPDPARPLSRVELQPDGFWWVYCPLRFDDFAIVLIAQENGDGFRSLNYAVRVFRDGTVEQLGWPRFETTYAPGTRRMVSARIHLTDQQGKSLTVDVEPKTSLTLQIGAGMFEHRVAGRHTPSGFLTAADMAR